MSGTSLCGTGWSFVEQGATERNVETWIAMWTPQCGGQDRYVTRPPNTVQVQVRTKGCHGLAAVQWLLQQFEELQIHTEGGAQHSAG